MKSARTLSIHLTVFFPALFILSKSIIMPGNKEGISVPAGKSVCRPSLWKIDELARPQWVIAGRERPQRNLKTYSCYWINK